MKLFARLFVLCALVFSMDASFAGRCGACAKDKNCEAACDPCCGQMGGAQYCDSSAGRIVCNNGFYSSCYCNRHAVMDFGHLQGCCLWQGGVLKIDELTGYVICNNGGVSEVCSLQNPPQSVAIW